MYQFLIFATLLTYISLVWIILISNVTNKVETLSFNFENPGDIPTTFIPNSQTWKHINFQDVIPDHCNPLLSHFSESFSLAVNLY